MAKMTEPERLVASRALREQLEKVIEQTPKGISDREIMRIISDILGYRMARPK